MAVKSVVLSGGGATGIMPLIGPAAPGPQTVMLGRKPPKARPHALKFAKYFNTHRATAPPATVDYSAKAMSSLSRMYLNDTLGDCVIAGKYHAEGVWSGNHDGATATVVGTDAEVKAAYVTICGPGDQGCVITDVLDYFQKNGLVFSGNTHKIDGYVSVDWTNKLEVQVALYIFGALPIGINLPQAWTTSDIWDVTNTNVVGGHDVTCVGYNAQGVQIASWGRIYTITWAAFQSKKWLEECYATLAPDWYGSNKLAPSGFDTAALQADLASLGGGTIPPVGPPGPPNPPPVGPPGPPNPPGPTPLGYSGPLQGSMMLSGGKHQLTGTLTLQPAGANFSGAITGVMAGPLGNHPFTATVTLTPTAKKP